MKNGKPSLIQDVRYFSDHHGGYLTDDEVAAYGRRLAWYLNSKGISLGAYHSLYTHFTPTLPVGDVALDAYSGGNELWWQRNVRVGIDSDFTNAGDAHETAMHGTVAALKTLLPSASAMIDEADTMVRQHAGDLRFLIGKKTYKKYTLNIATTIATHPQPSRIYVTVTDTATAAKCETLPLPAGFYDHAFHEANSINLKDLNIETTTEGHLIADWCDAIRTGSAAILSVEPKLPNPYYSQLVRRR